MNFSKLIAINEDCSPSRKDTVFNVLLYWKGYFYIIKSIIEVVSQRQNKLLILFDREK